MIFKRLFCWICNKFTWNSKRKKYVEFIRYYRQHPDKYCEEFLGLELFDYQKELLIKLCNENDESVLW